MRAMTALIKREYFEHRGAFLYAPSILLAVVAVIVLFAILTGDDTLDLPATEIPSSGILYQIAIGGSFLLWSAYLLIVLYFYYADSFSADRRNNALLFWKSMPQSDLKVLAAKALAGVTVFLWLIVLFALLTAVFVYAAMLLISAQHSIIGAPGLADAVWSLVQMGVVGAVYLFLNLLWYAPLFAWVAGLSVLFRRWSIPLSLLIPGTVVMLEYLNSIRGSGHGRPIADYLSRRFDGATDEEDAVAILIGRADGGPIELLWLILRDMDWPQMAIGLIFAAVVVYLASEYRRRRIDA
ncbi:hypothetical protein [Nitratireductor sp. XY-223]|uniref:hypothetical protein n=1 Tax=Nitratireductor sp. XY-223 TaxID=2561926 RepID=UPI0010AADCA2|nr:hypothetical protein [Nitratireductor sp. XY-223]